MRLMRYLLPLVFVSASFPCMALPALEVKLSTAPSLTESVVHISAKNVGDKVVFLLRPHTPFGLVEGRLQGSWFDVSDATGKRVDYQGRQVLIRDPGAASFLQLVPGESIDADVDLAREYRLPRSGHVSVQIRLIAYLGLPSHNGMGETQLAPQFDVRSESIEVSVPAGTSMSAAAPAADNVVPCTADQSEQTAKAFYRGANTSDIRNALLELSYYYDPIDPAFPEKPPRKHMTRDFNYVYWLGEWDDAAPQAPDPAAESTDNVRIDRVVSAVAERVVEGFEVVCDLCPGSDSRARAWTDGTNRVHLCPAHFLDPITGGISSQAGTLIHEASHINDDRARPTVDKPGVINRATAHALARTDAVDSGANYEYYIMDVPRGF